MAEHTATITWSRGNDDFLDKRYHRSHTWQFDGGATVAASSSPHVVPLPYSDAAAVDPEEAYVAALSSCHMLWFMDFASRAGYRLNHYTDAAVGTMAKNAEGQLVVTHVQLRPVTRFDAAHAPSAAQLDELHHRAHTSCFLANSVKTQIDCAPVLEVEGGADMANPNRQFQVADAAAQQALVRAQPLATLVIAQEGSLHVNHIPLYLDPARGPQGTLIGHVARANALWPLLPQQAVAVFHGPQAYVSPSWYPSKALDGKQVPTWNYATVHAHGALSAFDDPERLRAILHTLSEQHEAHRADPWRIDDAPPDYIDKLLRAIVGIELAVERWEGIWKVSQNRTDTDRAGVVQGLMAEGTSAAEDMAALVLDRLMG